MLHTHAHCLLVCGVVVKLTKASFASLTFCSQSSIVLCRVDLSFWSSSYRNQQRHSYRQSPRDHSYVPRLLMWLTWIHTYIKSGPLTNITEYVSQVSIWTYNCLEVFVCPHWAWSYVHLYVCNLQASSTQKRYRSVLYNIVYTHFLHIGMTASRQKWTEQSISCPPQHMHHSDTIPSFLTSHCTLYINAAGMTLRNGMTLLKRVTFPPTK